MRTRILLSVGLLTSAVVLPLTLRGASVPQQPLPASNEQTKHAPIYVAWQWPESTKRYRPRIRRTIEEPVQLIQEEKKHSYLPVVDQEDIREEHKIIVDEVLRALPERCQGTLTNFFVRYDNPGNRGLAGKNTIVMSGDPPEQEFRALFIHELGHVFDLTHSTECMYGTEASGTTTFRDGSDFTYRDDPSYAFYRISWINEKTKKTGSSASDFVTGYAAWDVFEDFAESFVYFVLQNEDFKNRATQNAQIAQKYAWFQTYLFPDGIDLAQGNYVWNGNVPWDATKLAYEWNTQEEQVASSR